MKNKLLFMLAMVATLYPLTSLSAPTSSHVLPIQRIELNGRLSFATSTFIEVSHPTLLQPIREDFVASTISGIGELRIGAHPVGSAGVYPIYPPAWVNGDIYLPSPGIWQVNVRGEPEDPTDLEQRNFKLPYQMLENPSSAELSAVAEGLSAGRPAYHAEDVTSTWNQIMKVEQRLIVRQHMTLAARGGDLRYRWGGPPANPDGIAYDLLHDGETRSLGPAPLSSLWVRADMPGETVTINLVPQRLR